MPISNEISIFKDIVIPLLTIILAAIVFFAFVWQERKKIELKAEENINLVSKSIYRDLLYLQEQWQLLGLEQIQNQINPNRITLIREIFARIKSNLYERPEIFENYFRNIELKTKDNKIFLLLGELECDFMDANLSYNFYINYAIYKLLSYWETDEAKLSEIAAIIKQFENSNDSRIKSISSAL